VFLNKNNILKRATKSLKRATKSLKRATKSLKRATKSFKVQLYFSYIQLYSDGGKPNGLPQIIGDTHTIFHTHLSLSL